MKLNEEQILRVFNALNFTEIEHTIMLHIFKNYTCKSQKINLGKIARKTDYTLEGIRRILARAITKIINNPVSEELFGKDINPQIAKRKREIIECINDEAYSKKFPDIYSFFAPFYTKEEVQSILEQLTQKQNRILEDVEYWHKTKFPPQGYRLDMRESFFRIVEYIFEKLIESYGVRLINQEETNEKPYDPELNVIASKALRRTIPASLPIIKKCPNFASQKKFNYTDSTSGIFDCPELEQYPRWLIVNALKKINKKGLSILHKAYGSNFRWPTPHKVRGITLTDEDSREISIIKNTIISIIKRAIKNNEQKSKLKLKYNEYIELIDKLISLTPTDKDVNSDTTRNNMIVFLFFGTDECQPLSIDVIAQIFNISTSDIRKIILKYLKELKREIEITSICEKLICMLEDDLIDNNALIIEPTKVKRKRYIRI